MPLGELMMISTQVWCNFFKSQTAFSHLYTTVLPGQGILQCFEMLQLTMSASIVHAKTCSMAN